MGYEIIDGITRADIAFRVSARNLNELFFSGAEALLSVMIEDINSIAFTKEKHFSCKDTVIDLLLHSFLQEILFFKDAESLLLVPKGVKLVQSDDSFNLDCVLHGEGIDACRHSIKLDVKAVTLHNLTVQNTGEQWIATFVVDI